MKRIKKISFLANIFSQRTEILYDICTLNKKIKNFMFSKDPKTLLDLLLLRTRKTIQLKTIDVILKDLSILSAPLKT